MAVWLPSSGARPAGANSSPHLLLSQARQRRGRGRERAAPAAGSPPPLDPLAPNPAHGFFGYFFAASSHLNGSTSGVTATSVVNLNGSASPLS
jgi:hypothetical protein